MAENVKYESTLRAGFMTVGGKDYSLVIDRPKDDLTEAEIYTQVNKIMTSDVIKPDGTSLSAIKSLKLVNKEETVLDLDALASN